MKHTRKSTGKHTRKSTRKSTKTDPYVPFEFQSQLLVFFSITGKFFRADFLYLSLPLSLSLSLSVSLLVARRHSLSLSLLWQVPLVPHWH